MCYGHFKYLVISFGLTNTPATFQSYINHALCEYIDDFYVVYLNDVLVFSRTKENYQRYLKMIIKCLYCAELYMNSKKCDFFQSKIEYLGFIINKNRIWMDSECIKAIFK